MSGWRRRAWALDAASGVSAVQTVDPDRLVGEVLVDRPLLLDGWLRRLLKTLQLVTTERGDIDEERAEADQCQHDDTRRTGSPADDAFGRRGLMVVGLDGVHQHAQRYEYGQGQDRGGMTHETGSVHGGPFFMSVASTQFFGVGLE